MPLYSFEGKRPTVHPDAWIAPTATLVGDVVVEAGVSIWYGAVIRADLGTITIRAGANIQDNTVIHVGHNGCEIGPNATVGHQCLVHDCTIGEQALWSATAPSSSTEPSSAPAPSSPPAQQSPQARSSHPSQSPWAAPPRKSSRSTAPPNSS